MPGKQYQAYDYAEVGKDVAIPGVNSFFIPRHDRLGQVGLGEDPRGGQNIPL